MGYFTDFYGNIEFKSDRAVKIVNYLIKKEIAPFNCCDEIYFGIIQNKNILQINASWKNYSQDMEKLCLFIVTLDKNAKGEVECSGEDKLDVWRIKIEAGDVEIHKAHTDFISMGCFENKEIKNKVKEYSKNKTIDKILMLEELIDENEKE